jgi:hypothetical protein
MLRAVAYNHADAPARYGITQSTSLLETYSPRLAPQSA